MAPRRTSASGWRAMSSDAPDRAARRRPRPPQWRMIFMVGLFAATVYAATEGLLRLAVDAPPVVDAQEPLRIDAAATPGPAPGTTPGPASGKGSAQAPAPAPAPGAERGAESAPPAAEPAATPPTRDPAAKDGGEDSNVEEQAEGGRRAAAPRASDEDAPEYRESADNNISLPVDI